MKLIPNKHVLLNLIFGSILALNVQAQNLSDALERGQTLALGVGVNGQVTEILVAPGDIVEQGQHLLSINAEQYRSQLEAAQANLDYANFKTQLADEDYERQQELFEEGSLSTVELQGYELIVKQAKSERAAARAGVHAAKQDLASAEIMAPAKGEIVAVPMVGQQVNVEAGVPVLIKIRLQ